MTPTRDCLDEDRVAALLEGRTSADDRLAMEAHVQTCAPCRTLVAESARAFSGDDTILVGDQAAEADGSTEATAVAPTRLLSAGATVGRYVIREAVGAGGMGVVYAAYDPDLDRPVAIKVLRPRGSGSGGSSAEATRLLREAQALARLSHPHVVAIYDVGTIGGQVFLAMEFLEGRTLWEWLRERPRPWTLVLEVFRQAGEGLLAAHAKGLVHRDFKPDNVIVTWDGRVRVTDFGLARHVGEAPGAPPPSARGEASAGAATAMGSLRRLANSGSQTAPLIRRLTLTGTVLGTPRYMPPEQLAGRQADEKSDVFSFCVALYEGLYGVHPFGGDTPEEIHAAATEGRPQEPGRKSLVPGWVFRALQPGVSPDPADRPSLADLLHALGRDPARARRRLLGTAGVAVAAATATLVTWLVVGGAGAEPCQAATAKLRGIWDAPRKAAVRASLLASGKSYVAGVWKRVEAGLDAYARDWVRMSDETCAATRIRREQSEDLMDLRMQCLDLRRSELRELVGQLSRADARLVRRAPVAVGRLSDLSACADVRGLLEQVRPPGGAPARAELASIQALLARGNALRAAGRPRQARQPLTDALQRARRLAHPPLVAQAALALGAVLETLDRRSEAEARNEEAAWSALAARADRLATRAAIALVYIGRQEEKRERRSELWTRHARASLARIGGDEYLESQLARQRGSLHVGLNRYRLALESYRRALRLRRRARPHDLAGLSSLENGIGVALKELGRYAESVVHRRRSLALGEKIYGRRHPSYGYLLGGLAATLADVGRGDEAVRAGRRAIGILEDAYGAKSPTVAIYYANHGAQLRQLGRYAEAAGVEKRALKILVAAMGENHRMVVGFRQNHGATLVELGRLDEAMQQFRLALAAFGRSKSPDYKYWASAISGVGLVHLKAGRFRDALREFQRSLAMWNAKVDSKHPYRANLICHVADAYRKLGRLGLASARFREALALLEKRRQPGTDLAIPLTGLGEIALAKREPLQAIPLLERALAVRDKHPEEPAARAETRFALARALRAARRDPTRALRLAKKARDEFTASGPGYRNDRRAVQRWLAGRLL